MSKNSFSKILFGLFLCCLIFSLTSKAIILANGEGDNIPISPEPSEEEEGEEE